MNDLTHIDLFSGIGGFALAARWAGIKTVQFVELDPFCQKVLRKNFGKDIFIHDDIKTFNINSYTASKRLGRGSEDSTRQQSSLSGKIISENEHDDIKTFTNTDRPKDDATQNNNRRGKSVANNGAEVRSFNSASSGTNRPFLLTGGFPCQPFSCAGKRKGTSDDRHLWPEMLRVIKEFKPTWIIGENVAGIRSMELVNSDSAVESNPDIQEDGENDYTTVLDGICNDLEGIGYEVQPIIIPACAVGAPHRRDRVWIVAHANNGGSTGEIREKIPRRQGTSVTNTKSSSRNIGGNCLYRQGETDSHAPDTEKSKCELSGRTRTGREGFTDRSSWDEPWLEVATSLCGVDDGVSQELYKLETSDRVARLKALGNAIVPQVAFEIMKAILKVENES